VFINKNKLEADPCFAHEQREKEHVLINEKKAVSTNYMWNDTWMLFIVVY